MTVGPSPRNGSGAAPQIRFSIVSAVYNVQRYLADYIESIESQSFSLDRVEVIVIDDGSTDDSLETLEKWAKARPGLVTVLSQVNGGQGSARNLGLEHAHGEWVTFLDPDDMIDPNYLKIVDAFIKKHESVTMVATNRILLLEATGEILDGHPLRQMFSRDKFVNLERFPDLFHGSAPSAFFRTAVIRSAGLRYDSRVRPNFEDGHFCVGYLLAVETPLVGFLKSARYLYRKRADNSSTLQIGSLDPRRFLDVPRYGYLDVLQRAAAGGGRPPEWLQNFVIYELSIYLGSDSRPNGAATAARGAIAEEFVTLLREIVALLDPWVIESYDVHTLGSVRRDLLLHAFSGEPWATPYAVMRKLDSNTGELQLAYRYFGEAPSETILFRGQRIEPRHAKTRSYVYFEQPLMHERLIWVPANGIVRLALNGVPVGIRRYWPGRSVTALRPSDVRARFKRSIFARPAQPAQPKWRSAGRERSKLRAKDSADERTSFRDLATVRAARTRLVRRFFGGAWVLMDRIHDADDNAEHLFRYLRKRRRNINAWFVVERGTPDWNRLKKEGYHRVVAHGSLLWRLLMLNCEHLISSHIDLPIQEPPDIVALTQPRWKFSFLQHGVIKDDLSAWLNRKQIDLFVTSTPGEYQSIVGDGTQYIFSSKETKLTGLPRFDRLREVGNSVPPAERDLILVCPTWRNWLNPPLAVGSQRRVVTDDFLDSEYVQQWVAFLTSAKLRETAEAHGLKVGFLPHPNIQPALSRMSLPDHVEPLSFAGRGVQRLIARSAVMVTDYSSMVFNGAYIDRPVVYFQFDAEQMFSGAHVGRAGYFDYLADGFGPVTYSIDDAVHAVAQAVGQPDGRPMPEYEQRIAATFPLRDGKCCERVVAEIENLSRLRRPKNKKPALNPSG